MPIEMLEKELAGLPDDKIMVLVEFARFLKQSAIGTVGQKTVQQNKSASSPKRQLGSMAKDFISIAPDFDTCLDGLEEFT